MTSYIDNGILKFSILDKFPQIKAGFFTTLFGNLGYTNNNHQSCFDNRLKAFQTANILLEDCIFQDQQHTDHIKIVSASQKGKGIFRKELALQNNDGMITSEKNIVLTVAAADCAPVYLIEPEKEIITLLHSGRKGTQLKITEKAINMMISLFGVEAENLIAIIGPSICKEHYQINEDIAIDFHGKFCEQYQDKIYLDITEHIINQLKNFGIKNIYNCEICTYENSSFFSYRREGKNHGTGLGYLTIKR